MLNRGLYVSHLQPSLLYFLGGENYFASVILLSGNIWSGVEA